MGTLSWTLLLLAWVATGATAVVLLLHRRGHREGSWLLIGAVLGPLVVPIALERAARTGRRLERRVARAADPAPARDDRLCVLVGVDGSPESEQAVRDAARLVAPAVGRLLLVTVVDPDVTEARDGGEEQRRRARELLEESARALSATAATVETEVVAGQPGPCLLQLAEDEDVDLVVVGRRGRGLSRTVLGSAATTLSSRAGRPVLLAAPPGARP
ncbi:Nucleotide-binding universal stress protein, UspA family [Geodermatophilus dictyosporus]|uniref:Nucleotide-binding universal stress protein, UspA family n=1 Tax=Geodermatophilus dictyosporus TaxID=1523247 RepID=A0A1I5JTB0_9ACTN|nr:universal stress protein [Geodermatophilus dictyosporus]SFO76062.1 Nucleotide-binding universal stress protein, UspA family [Geodermatophilus dictyosporus]